MFKTLLEKEFVILDGAMGTLLQQSGLKLGERPERLNFTNPMLIESIHEKYLKAGADIIYTNTFGANAHKLEGTGYSVQEVIQAAVGHAKSAVKKVALDTGRQSLVGLDIGPIGELLEPSGTLSFEEAYVLFKEMLVAGEAAGADVVIFETMTDLYEVKAAVLAAKEHTQLPILVTMTFEQNGRTFTGCGIENMALTLQGLGVDALGVNCSLGPIEILPLIQDLCRFTTLPLIVKPNAGLPHPETGAYAISAQVFAQTMKEYAKVGVKIMGGCCGTTEVFIKALVEALVDEKCVTQSYEAKTKFCSATEVVTVDTVRVIGERINPTGKKRFVQALNERDFSYILSQAIQQVEAGADLLDVNVGVPQLDEASLMKDVVKAIQSVVATPLQIDSSKYEALEAGLRVYNGKPILNSVNGEEVSLRKILPLAKKYGAAIVGLTMDESGLPKSVEQRVAIAKKILNQALAYGIPKEDVLIDCLTLTVSAQQKDCMDTLKAMRIIKEELGLELVLGVSNISFGLPNRELMNWSFLTMAMTYGLTLPIMNPNAEAMMDAVYAHRVLVGEDKGSENYIKRYKDIQNKPLTKQVKKNEGIKQIGEAFEKNSDREYAMEVAIMKGLGDEVEALTKVILQEKKPLEMVNSILIPTLDKVGECYEKGEFFLPQLIRSASACCRAFDEIKAVIASNNGHGICKGKIILATVKGDIHDIGKNIAKVILENYGYEVIDLGKDVPPEEVVRVAIEQEVRLIGLSALMTTTVEAMRETISQLRASKHECQIMVGGAVLTADYAEKIRADYYVEDAKRSVEIAKHVLG